MSYLTQLTLDFASIARLQIRDVYDWHQRAWQCFPGRNDKPRDFLTRLERQGDSLRLLILSQERSTRPDWCPPECWQGPKAITESYFSHPRYRFCLCANPTKKVAVQNADGSFKKNGRRLPLRNREELVAWIERKGAQSGFAVDQYSLRTIPQGREYFRKSEQAGLHDAVEFQGILAVTDLAMFREAFSRGIGSAKAFGFGLLVIQPIS